MIVVVFVLCFAWFWYALEDAPDGYEDETGFHYRRSGRQ